MKYYIITTVDYTPYPTLSREGSDIWRNYGLAMHWCRYKRADWGLHTDEVAAQIEKMARDRPGLDRTLIMQAALTCFTEEEVEEAVRRLRKIYPDDVSISYTLAPDVKRVAKIFCWGYDDWNGLEMRKANETGLPYDITGEYDVYDTLLPHKELAEQYINKELKLLRRRYSTYTDSYRLDQMPIGVILDRNNYDGRNDVTKAR